jgi:hypothetical protein
MNGCLGTALDNLLSNRRDNLTEQLVDIFLFSHQTSSCLSSFETDLIILLPFKQHPPCIINHRKARFAERQIGFYMTPGASASSSWNFSCIPWRKNYFTGRSERSGRGHYLDFDRSED